MLHKSKPLTAILISTTVLSGCSHLEVNKQASMYGSEVKPVMTESSLALSCLGKLIDASEKPHMTIYIDNIDDETVPRRYFKRRLSQGGAWWLHTAIVKMQSERVTSSVRLPSRKKRTKAPHLVLRGAWTQDDLEVGKEKQGIDIKNKGDGYFNFFDWQRNQEVSIIAGDFISEIDGKVVHASAISLAVGGSRNDINLRIDDGPRQLDMGIVSEINEGPQFAQRRIVEAAALVHIAKAFNIDYRDCVNQEEVNPQYFQQQIKTYLSMSEHEQFKVMQEALSKAGFNPGTPDGKWGKKSEQALISFQSANGIPITGIPSAELYSLVINKKLKTAEMENGS